MNQHHWTTKILAKLHSSPLEFLAQAESIDHLVKAETSIGDHMIKVSAGAVDSTLHQSPGSLEMVTQCHGELRSVATLAHFQGFDIKVAMSSSSLSILEENNCISGWKLFSSRSLFFSDIAIFELQSSNVRLSYWVIS